MSFRRLLSTLASAAVVLGACAGYGPTDVAPGQTEADVVRSMGLPTGRYPLPGGASRLEYARGPYGRQTYMVDLDPTGRVLGWQQVLTQQNFLRVLPGMSRGELLLLLGRPGEVFAVPWQKSEVWNYRYATNDCLWFQVTVTLDGVVKDSGHGVDRRCDGASKNF